MKKRIKKLLSITLSACMILPVFSVSVVEAKPEETIRVWYWEDNDGSYADAYDTWSEQYPDVNLELEAIPWNSYHDTLIAAAASGDHKGHRAALQRHLRRRIYDPGALHGQGGCKDHEPAGSGKEDEQIRREPEREHLSDG